MLFDMMMPVFPFVIQTKLEKVAITLDDCLACSGCITSAESVLISQQTHHELYSVLRQNTNPVEASPVGSW